ncbi:MAG: amphi-Trp domain-containing protein [Syntrophales bacterium]
MSSQHLQIKTKTDFSVVIGFLESLIECLKRGTIFLTHDGKSIQLKPQTPISMDLTAEVKAIRAISKEKIVFKLQWEIPEIRPRGEEMFSIAGPDLADGKCRDLPVSSRKSGKRERKEEENRPSKSNRPKGEASTKTIEKKPVGRVTESSKPSVRKKRR